MRKLLFLGAIVLAASATACGGGGGGGSPPAPPPIATPTPPQITSAGETYPSGTATAIPIGTYAFRIVIAPVTSTLPAGGAPATLTYALPTGITAINAPADTKGLLFFGLEVNQNVTFSGQPGFTVTVPAPANPSYHLGCYSTITSSYNMCGGAIPSGTTVTLGAGTTAVTYTGNTTYFYELY